MTHDNDMIRRGDAMDMCYGYWRDTRTRIMSIPAVAASQPDCDCPDTALCQDGCYAKQLAASQPADPVINADSRQRVTVKPLDLINRMDAIQACQVGPSDEWSKATKSGYEQAATDCARNILKISPAAIDVQTDTRDAQIAALVEALIVIDALDPEGMVDGCSQSALRGLVTRMGQTARAALVAGKGGDA